MDIRIIDDDPAAFHTLAREYETMLPHDLRHSDVDFEPDVALVALCDGEPCGCVALSRLDDERTVMKRLYVRPGLRNAGIARRLLDRLIVVAGEAGFDAIVLDTDRERLAAAYNLYRSYGFAECEPYGVVDYATPTFMRLTIASANARGAPGSKRT